MLWKYGRKQKSAQNTQGCSHTVLALIGFHISPCIHVEDQTLEAFLPCWQACGGYYDLCRIELYTTSLRRELQQNMTLNNYGLNHQIYIFSDCYKNDNVKRGRRKARHTLVCVIITSIQCALVLRVERKYICGCSICHLCSQVNHVTLSPSADRQ